MRVLICAGGTGGGIYPALAAVTALRNRGLATENILWVGTQGEMEQTLVPRAGIRLETIVGGAIAGVPLHRKLINGSKLLFSIGKALQIVRRFRPNVMFMTGGYMAFPFTLACRWLGVPIAIYLPDVEPGQSIQFSLRYAHKVGATTDGSAQFVPADKLVVTGYPVRPELREMANLSREEALAAFDLQPGRSTLMVFGGSRGAQAINRALMNILPELLSTIQIIHISGTFTWDEVDTNAKKLPKALRDFYRPYPYLHEQMGHAFRAADLVVARAGASMLGESPAFSLPSVLVPLAWAWRYQKVNADYLCERGTAVQLTDETLDEKLLPTIQTLMADPDKLAQMRQAARDLDVPNGAENLAALIESVAKTGGKE
ncbi:MAG: UDP-N-acetylglucosamine--N-acetylmuramyl-(pentapeptide) pyrophosphoryl-undecaprenol N-acetylglucosamine transferase [Anaerolineales bacterium]|nr:UDP-N-acetylglucosamine--N-acetylmuramyl-(pentapeptide) pyrophosphoryl-undecaprenol N-acetylglucosamine transferase [Anaerolineales bacterium]MCB8938124.1 UDP-N-acetylglucosamine--N-acetylmuramyl-(pentapeptide) pyrophosphoryl-undecaprenol N-acetylglucosamine transferase [Ardenticatenaceae bacterium]